MAVTPVGTPSSGSTAAGTSNTLPVTLPAGWQPGDRAILVAHISGGSLTATTPTGWDLLDGPAWPITEGSSSRVYGWTRALQAGDADFSLTISGAATAAWSLSCWRDHAGSPRAVTSTAVVSPLALPSLTGVGAGSALVAAAHARVGSGTIPGTLGWATYTPSVDVSTSRATASANVRAGLAHRITTAAGTYGGEQVTADQPASMIGLLVEVASAVTPVSGSVATTWNVAATATGSTATTWNVRQQATGSVTTTWAVAPTPGWEAAVAYTQYATLTANTERTFTFATNAGWVEVLNLDGSAEVYFTTDNTSPGVGADGSHVVPAAVAAVEVRDESTGNTVVKVRSAGTPRVGVRVW
ncbi:hypothetical protein ABZ949_02345 [Micromonospora tulbaghiae]|uniref:hypothetical protein n=1 Tax=Micromonospora tulbaghiae TaxID=479978 RepID=UPI0033F9CA17